MFNTREEPNLSRILGIILTQRSMPLSSPSKVAPGTTPPRCTYRKFDHREKLRCRFCRGDNCLRCGKEAYKQCTMPAISMFHCNWIFDSVLAMQRPSDELFDSIMLIEAFQCKGITAVRFWHSSISSHVHHAH